MPNWGKASWAEPKRRAMQKNWTAAVKDLLAIEAWNMVKEDLVDKVTTSVPKRPRRNPNRPAWMNQQILTEILKRKRMWKISKDSGRYEEQSRLVKQMIKNAKRKLERRLVDRLGGNNRPFYSYVRSKTKNIVGVGPLKDRTGQLVRGNKEMATMLKDHFSSVFTAKKDGPPEAVLWI